MTLNFASHLEKQGATQSDIALALGHSPSSTTAGYIHSNLERLSVFIEKMALEIMGNEVKDKVIENEKEKRSEALEPDCKAEIGHQEEIAAILDVSNDLVLNIKLINKAQKCWSAINGEAPMSADFLLGFASSKLGRREAS